MLKIRKSSPTKTEDNLYLKLRKYFFKICNLKIQKVRYFYEKN